MVKVYQRLSVPMQHLFWIAAPGFAVCTKVNSNSKAPVARHQHVLSPVNTPSGVPIEPCIAHIFVLPSLAAGQQQDHS